MKMNISTGLTDNCEKYLDAILRLENEDHAVRVKDLSIDLGLQKGSVSSALKSMKAAGLVNHSPYRRIRLTEFGRQQAEAVAGRNRTLVEFMVGVLHLDTALAEAAARRMGPAVETPVVEGMRRFMAWTIAPSSPHLT
jgi:DtxR family Mn-dependent transcriptional regulator